MNLADRIQLLRKSKGISQEELADRLGVSRQAVSKWESEQSTPDAENIIHLSEFLGVTTDYLLKGVEPLPPAGSRKKADAGVFAVTGAALCLTGLLAAALIWYETQTAAAFAGAIMMVMGYMIYAVGMIASDPATRPAARRRFRSAGVWILPFIPLSVLCNVLTWGRYGRIPPAPYPIFFPDGMLLFAGLYLLTGMGGTWYIRRKSAAGERMKGDRP